MAVGESAGTVFVTIDGDVSPLLAKYAQAETASRAAGQRIGTAFTAGTSTADPAAGLVDQYGRALLNTAAAAQVATAASTETAVAVRAVGTAAEGTTVKMYEASAAIRTAFGETSIRAVERLTTMIPGLSTLFANLFPIFGLIQLGLMFERATEKSEALKAAEKELEDQNKKLDQSFDETARTIYRVAEASAGRAFGPAAETKERIAALNDEGRASQRQVEQLKQQIHETAAAAADNLQTHPWRTYSSDAQVAKDKVAALGKQIEEEQEKQRRLGIERSGLEELTGTQLDEQRGALAVKTIEATEQASVRAAEISKQRYTAEIDAQHAAQSQRIAGLESEYARVVATGQEEIRFEKAKEDEIAGYALATRDRTIKEIAAKSGAESAGKSAPEQALIQTGARADTQKAKDEFTLAAGKAALDVQKSQADAALKLDELNQKVAQTLRNDVREGWDKVAAAARETQKISQDATTKELQGQTRATLIEDKARAEVGLLQIKQKQIELEGTYAAQVGHTRDQEISYITQIGALEQKEIANKIAGLEIEKQDAEAIEDTAARLEKVAQIQGQINVLRQQGRNQQAGTLNQTAAAQRQGTLGPQLGAAGTQGVASLSNAISEGVMHGGKGIGKDIKASLQNIGKEMLGDAIKTGVEDMVIAITGNTIAPNLNTLWTQIQALAGFFGFADGTDSAPGGMALVGERGPEIVNLPRGSQVIPNHKISKYADGTPGYASATTYQSTAFQTASTTLHFHAHGVSNPDAFIDHVMRKLPETLKRRSPQFSPLAR
jgi:hypothetical protein